MQAFKYVLDLILNKGGWKCKAIWFFNWVNDFISFKWLEKRAKSDPNGVKYSVFFKLRSGWGLAPEPHLWYA